MLVKSANEAGKVYTQTTLDRVQGDINTMVATNKAQVIKVDTAAFRKKMEPFYEDLVKDKLLTPEILSAIKAL